MDIYTYLRNDHQKVDDLFEKLFSLPREKEEDYAEQESVFEELMEEFLLHSDSEEKTFYEALKNNPQSKADIKHSFEEHAEAKELLEKINKLSPEDKEWLESVKALQKAIQHHVKFEEEEIFGLAKDILDEKQAQELVEQMKKLKNAEAVLPIS